MRRTLTAFGLGAVVALSACGGGDGDEEKTSQAREETPVEAPPPVPVLPEDTIAFTNTAGSGLRSHGCTASLKFIWRADDPESVPDDAAAVIKVTGPGVAGRYKRSVEAGKVALRLSTPKIHRTTADFDATLLTVAGEPVPLAAPNAFQFLNTSCGKGGGSGGGSYIPTLPPGVPVQGAPCDPNVAPPPGFECKSAG